MMNKITISTCLFSVFIAAALLIYHLRPELFVAVKSKVQDSGPIAIEENTNNLYFVKKNPSHNFNSRSRNETHKPLISGKNKVIFDDAIAVIDRHRVELGMFSGLEIEAYKVYSDETLTSLTRAGDIKAILVFAERTSESGNYELARLLYIDAATRGAISAFHYLSSVSSTLQQKAFEAGDHESAGRYRIEGMAWLEMLNKREFHDPLFPDFINAIPVDVEVNLDMKAVHVVADRFYQNMIAQRHNLGLGDFNNQVVREYIVSMNKIYELGEKYSHPDFPEDNKGYGGYIY